MSIDILQRINEAEYRVLIINLPGRIPYTEIISFFEKKIGKNEAKLAFTYHSNDKKFTKGALVTNTLQGLQKALECHKSILKGNEIAVMDDRGNHRNIDGEIIGNQRYNNGRGPSDIEHDTFGLSFDFLSSRNIGLPLVNVITVKNFIDLLSKASLYEGEGVNEIKTSQSSIASVLDVLDQALVMRNGFEVKHHNKAPVAKLHADVTKKLLKEVFRMAGNVINLIQFKKNAIVEYSHPVESVQAISMFDKQKLLGEMMHITLFRNKVPFKMPEGLSNVGHGLGPGGKPLKNIRAFLFHMSKMQNANRPVGGPTGNEVQGNIGTGFGLSDPMMRNVPSDNYRSMNNRDWNFDNNQDNNIRGNLPFQPNSGPMFNFNNEPNQNCFNQQSVSSMGLTLYQQIAQKSQTQVSNTSANNDQPFSGSSSQSNLMETLKNKNTMNDVTFPNKRQKLSQDNRISHSMEDQRYSPTMDKTPSPVPPPAEDEQDLITIKNLAGHVTDNQLEEKFSMCGKVRFAEVMKPGYAIVRYYSAKDAVRAFRMFDGSSYEGKKMTIEFQN